MSDEFILTDDHLALLHRMYVGYDNCCETGAPVVDPKRPYGNSDVVYDVMEILGIKPLGDPDDHPDDPLSPSDEQIAEAYALHEETEEALQIVLCTMSFRPGVYRKKEHYDSRSWEFIREA